MLKLWDLVVTLIDYSMIFIRCYYLVSKLWDLGGKSVKEATIRKEYEINAIQKKQKSNNGLETGLN